MSKINNKKEDISGVIKVKCATTLKSEVIKALETDTRFIGLAKYMEGLVFWWTREIDTACAGHGFIFFNPEFYESLPKETRKTIIAHEVWHLILKHLERSEGYEPNYYNQAADHVINLMLEEEGFDFKGTDPCKDAAYIGMSTEEIYRKIYIEPKPEDRPKVQPSQNVNPAKIKELIEAALDDQKSNNQTDNETIEDQKKKNDNNIAKEKRAGKLKGNQSIRLDMQNLKVIIKSKTYQEIFQKYLIDPLGGGRRSFMRPNRRQQGLSKKLVLPGRLARKGEKNRLTHLVYALDVSGSISHKQAQQFHNSVRTIKELLHPKKLTVLFFDTRIVLEKTFQDTEKYETITVKAGGGTSLNPVYKRVAEINPEALVIFTDLCVDIPPKPSWDTIWLVPFNVRSKPDLYGDLYLIPEQGKK